MNYLFAGLAIANTILILLTAGTGYLAFRQQIPTHMHILAGLFVAIFTCLIHSIIFVYFLGTGKSVKTACEEYKLEGDFVRITRKLKGRAFPFALFGSLAIMGAAFTGGAVSTHALATPIHLTTIFIAFGINIVCFFFEYKAVRANMNLFERLAAALPDDAESKNR